MIDIKETRKILDSLRFEVLRCFIRKQFPFNSPLNSQLSVYLNTNKSASSYLLVYLEKMLVAYHREIALHTGSQNKGVTA